MGKYDSHPQKPTVYQINRVLSTDLYAGIYRDMDDFYPAYITKEQLQMIQSTSDTKTYPHTSEPYIFSGLIRCPHCGGILTGFRKRNKCKDGSYTFYKRYKCSRKFAFAHPSPCITESVAEAYLLQHICPVITSTICSLQKTGVRTASKAPAIRAEMERLNILFQKGRISDEYYDNQYEMLEAELQKESAVPDDHSIERYESLAKEFSGDWIDLYEMLDASHKNAFWKRIIKEIQVDKDTHKICGFTLV
jgi:hypothetical protein